MPQITLDEIRERYLTNPHREALFAEFDHELPSWQDYLDEVRVWLFGSFFTDKEQPGDIDVLLAGRLKRGTPLPPKLPRRFKDEVHVLPSLVAGDGAIALASKVDLVRKFNEQEGNKQRDIQLDIEDVIDLFL